MKTKFVIATTLLCAATMAVSPNNLSAQEFSTDPVGVVNLTLLGDSDTLIGVPLHRPPAFQGVAAGAVGDTITVGVDEASTPSWEPGEFAYQQGVQPDTFYVILDGGPQSGAYFTVLNNGVDSLVVDDAGYNLAEAVEEGVTLRVIPYWTLGTLFPDGEGVHGSSTHFSRPTTVLLFNQEQAGINLANNETFYYFAGSPAGWRRIGGGLNTIFDDTILLPDSYFVVRHSISEDTEMKVVGAVGVWSFNTPVNVLESDTPQDNLLNLPAPVPLTLGETNLVQSGAFEGSSSHFARRDTLLVFDNAQRSQNKANVATYYYFTGEPAGWRRIGGGLNNVLDNDPDHALLPGQGFIIRKATHSEAATFVWNFIPPFLESD